MSQRDRSKAVGFNLDFLSEPAMLVDLDGKVHGANSAARQYLIGGCQSQGLFDIALGARSDVIAFLRRASGSTSSHMGVLELSRGDTVERFRALAARVQLSDEDGTLLILRLFPPQDFRFTVLNQRLREIDRQLHQRNRENALLSEALEANKVLVRELQHRVKNNIQQMLSLINFSAANRNSPEVSDFVAAAGRRLHAMATTQEAIYQTNGAASLSACKFMDEVIKGVATSFDATDRLHLSIEDVKLSPELAHSLALISNELTTNAFKYGRGQVSVRLWTAEETSILEVQDEGSGFDEKALSRNSGLRLVRSLCRQIGGKFQLETGGCCKCSVHFETGRN